MKTILSITLVLFVVIVQAQESNLIADKNFQNMAYAKAAKQYESILMKGNTSQQILERIGDSYFFNTDMKNAAKWYGELFANYQDNISSEYVLRYIHALKGVEDYKMAKSLMKDLENKKYSSNKNTDQLREERKMLDELLNNTNQFQISNLAINTPYSDFGTTVYKDKIIFSSSRDSTNLFTRIYEWNEQPYLDFYQVDSVSIISDEPEIKAFSSKINGKFHEAIATINSEGTIMYFTRNNYTDKRLKRDNDGINHLKIYRSLLKDGKWSKPMEVPFNSDDYSVGQPALSPDGSKLYFVSDMPGTLGQTDIFVVEVLSDGTYSTPKNLGSKINTSGREMFPFVTEDNLYFASDGHLGLGGLDVFESYFTENGLSSPENLGQPLNGSKDDFAYVVNENTQKGYFSSNRDGGVGDDDIYSFQRDLNKCNQEVRGTVVDKLTKEIVANAQIKLTDSSSKILSQTTSNTKGFYEFNTFLECNNNYVIQVEKEGYLMNEIIVESMNKRNFSHEIVLELDKEINKNIVEEDSQLKIKINDIYFDLNKSKIRNDAALELDKVVEIMNEYPNMIIKIESHTDSRGSDEYNLKLSDNRAKSTQRYIISRGIDSKRIESAIGYGESKLLNDCTNSIDCSDEEHDINRRSEFIIVSVK